MQEDLKAGQALEVCHRPTRVGKHPATVLETFGCWPRFWVYLNLFDLSDLVNITCIVDYGIEINIHTQTYIHTLEVRRLLEVLRY